MVFILFKSLTSESFKKKFLNVKKMRKSIQILSLAVMLALLLGLSSCVRNEMPVKQSTSKSKVDHLIIKEVFYIGHYWYRDVRQWGMKNVNQMYNDDQYIAIYNPTN